MSSQSSSPIPLAILGTGIFARTAHFPALLPLIEGPNPRFVLKAIYSRSLASAEKFLSLVREQASLKDSSSDIKLYYDSKDEAETIDALLDREDVKALLSVLPIDSQPQILEKAFRKGKYILSEKPVAPSVKDGLKLIALYEKEGKTTGTKWTVAENYAWETAFAKAREQLPKVGQLRGVEFYSSKHVGEGSQYHATSWRTVPSYQGGFVFDGGVHWPALFRALFSPIVSPSTSLIPTRISSLTAQHEPHLPPVDTVRSLVRFTNPSSPSAKPIDAVWTDVYATRGPTHRALVEITGTEGVLEIFKPAGEYRGYKVVVTRWDGKGPEEETYKSDGVEKELAAWADSLSGGQSDVRAGLVTPEEALKDVAVIEAMLTSGDKEGQWQDVEKVLRGE